MTPAEVARRFPSALALAKPCPPAEVIDSIQRATHHG